MNFELESRLKSCVHGFGIPQAEINGQWALDMSADRFLSYFIYFNRHKQSMMLSYFLTIAGKRAIPADKTGDFDMIYDFLKKNWKIAKWVALGAVILEALTFFLALIVRATNRQADYDSSDEYIATRSNIHQPLISRQGAPASGIPVAGSLDQHPVRNDAWSTRMREKYGLNMSAFTYKPTEANRSTAQSAEERSWCSIM